MFGSGEGDAMAAMSSGEYYDAIARGYSRLHGEEQHAKMRVICEHLTVAPTDAVLSVGCGPCFVLDVWDPRKGQCREMVGVDPSAELIKQARRRGVTRAVVAKAEDMLAHARYLSLGADDDATCSPEARAAALAHFDVVVSLTAIQNFTDVVAGLENTVALGRDRFALTYLKRAAKARLIDETIERLLEVDHRIEQQHDIIYIAHKRK